MNHPPAATILAGACTACGACVDVCWTHVLDRRTNAAGAVEIYQRPERAASCRQCGHCMAVCPRQAIHIEGLEWDQDFLPLPKPPIRLDDFSDLIAGRRAVRAYRQTPVPRPVLESLLEAIRWAPMSYAPPKLSITVIDDPQILVAAKPLMAKCYRILLQKISDPFVRPFVRRSLPADEYTALTEHLLPTLPYRVREAESNSWDSFLRDAPAAILFHAPRDAGGVASDAVIALTYGLLAAHATGLGACGIGLIPPAVNRIPELRRLFQIPEGHEVATAMILGYPKYQYRRGIRRSFPAIRFLSAPD
jgi:nitroreductase/NAD-dependent dihydropyrimidine dehydrogenase PreA subunit